MNKRNILKFALIGLMSCSSLLMGLTLEEHQRITKDLRELPVEGMIPMSRHLNAQKYGADFKGEVYLVTLKGGLRGVFKAFPKGDDADALAEESMYRASLWAGFPEIPPTAIREIKGRKGSIQLYIKPSVDSLAPGQFMTALSRAIPSDVANLKLFYFVFGQWDTGPQNIIIQYDENDTAHLYPIDNASIRMRQFVEYGDLPFVAVAYSDRLQTDDWGQPFPFEKTHSITSPTKRNVQKELGFAFSDKFLNLFYRNNAPKTYVLYKNTLWLQYNKGRKGHFLSHTDFYPESTIQRLRQLDKKVLEKIFTNARSSYFVSDRFFDDILERRNQVLKAYEAQKQKG